MMAAMAVASSSAFAQADVVKGAKKLFDKGEFAQAVEAVKPALEAGTNEETSLKLPSRAACLPVRRRPTL